MGNMVSSGSKYSDEDRAWAAILRADEPVDLNDADAYLLMTHQTWLAGVVSEAEDFQRRANRNV